MGVYKTIYENVKRITSLVFNLINQLNGLYNKNESLFKLTFKNINFFSPFDTLGKALSIILTLDSILNENQDIKNHWELYKYMLNIVRTEPKKYNTTIEKVKAFERILKRMDKTILTGRCLKICLAQNFDVKDVTHDAKKGKGSGLIKDNKELREAFITYIKTNLQVTIFILNFKIVCYYQNIIVLYIYMLYIKPIAY